jgi:hypothetical protein
MFRWLALISAVVCVLALAGAILSSQQSYYSGQHPTAEKSDKGNNTQEKEIAFFDRWFPDSTAVFNLFLMIFTGVLAFGGLYQLSLLGRAEHIATETAQAAKQSADVAKDTLVATNRPWISVDIGIVSDLTYDAQGDARIEIKFDLKNVGKSPAANIVIDAEIVPIFGDAKSLQKTISDRNNARPPTLGDLGITLFPGDERTMVINLPISRASIEASNKEVWGLSGEKTVDKTDLVYFPTLLGCVDYKFTFSPGHHQTGFILNLRKRDWSHPNASLGFNVKDGTIIRNDLWLTQGFIGVPPT